MSAWPHSASRGFLVFFAVSFGARSQQSMNMKSSSAHLPLPFLSHFLLPHRSFPPTSCLHGWLECPLLSRLSSLHPASPSSSSPLLSLSPSLCDSECQSNLEQHTLVELLAVNEWRYTACVNGTANVTLLLINIDTSAWRQASVWYFLVLFCTVCRCDAASFAPFLYNFSSNPALLALL